MYLVNFSLEAVVVATFRSFCKPHCHLVNYQVSLSLMHLGVLVCGFEPCVIFNAWLSKIVKLGEVVVMVSRRIQVERHPSVVAGGRELLWGRKMEVPAPHSVRATPSVHRRSL